MFEVHFEKARGLFGEDASSLELRLSSDDQGHMVWTSDGVQKSTLQTVVDLINGGMQQKDIAAQLEVSQSRVSQMVRQARERGLLKSDGAGSARSKRKKAKPNAS